MRQYSGTTSSDYCSTTTVSTRINLGCHGGFRWHEHGRIRSTRLRLRLGTQHDNALQSQVHEKPEGRPKLVQTGHHYHHPDQQPEPPANLRPVQTEPRQGAGRSAPSRAGGGELVNSLIGPSRPGQAGSRQAPSMEAANYPPTRLKGA